MHSSSVTLSKAWHTPESKGNADEILLAGCLCRCAIVGISIRLPSGRRNQTDRSSPFYSSTRYFVEGLRARQTKHHHFCILRLTESADELPQIDNICFHYFYMELRVRAKFGRTPLLFF